MRRRWLLLGGAALLVLAAAVGVKVFLARGGHVTEIGVNDAVQRYRRASTVPTSEAVSTSAARPTSTATAPAVTQAPTTTTVVPSVPQPGVYQYATTGFDSVSALGGARHDYPAVTTMTVTADGCGVKVRWDVAKERWDDTTLCADASGVRTAGYTGYHQFFGVGDSNQFACEGPSRPLAAPAGTAWTMTCRYGTTSTTTFHCSIVGYEQVAVAGVPEPTQHVHCDVAISGASTGTQVIDRWVVPATGLVVHETGSTDTSSQTAVGKTRYHEELTLQLQSLVPRQ